MTLAVGLASLALVLGLRRFAPVVPGSLVAVPSASSHRRVSTTSGVDIVGQIDSGLPTVGLPDVEPDDLGTLAGAVGVMLVGFAEGLGAAKTYAAREHYEIDANRELLGLGGANLGAGLVSGMVVNGSLSKTAVNGGAGAQSAGLRARRGGAHRRHAAVPHGPVREAAGGDAGRGRHRGGDRARRRARARRLYRIADGGLARSTAVAARPDFVAAIAAMLGVLDLRHAARDCSSASACRCCCCSTARRVRTSPHSAACRARPTSTATSPGTRRTSSPEGVTVLRVESGLFFANADAATAPHRGARRGRDRVVLDAETVPSIDVTAARMLAEVADELERDGIGSASWPATSARSGTSWREGADARTVFPLRVQARSRRRRTVSRAPSPPPGGARRRRRRRRRRRTRPSRSCRR